MFLQYPITDTPWLGDSPRSSVYTYFFDYLMFPIYISHRVPRGIRLCPSPLFARDLCVAVSVEMRGGGPAPGLTSGQREAVGGLSCFTS